MFIGAFMVVIIVLGFGFSPWWLLAAVGCAVLDVVADMRGA